MESFGLWVQGFCVVGVESLRFRVLALQGSGFLGVGRDRSWDCLGLPNGFQSNRVEVFGRFRILLSRAPY